jgi:hypothetical protein
MKYDDAMLFTKYLKHDFKRIVTVVVFSIFYALFGRIRNNNYFNLGNWKSDASRKFLITSKNKTK